MLSVNNELVNSGTIETNCSTSQELVNKRDLCSQIYNEELLDLLVPASSRVKDSVAIREGTSGGIRITGLEERLVSSMEVGVHSGIYLKYLL